MDDDDDLINLTDEKHARIRATIGKRPEFDHGMLRALQLSDSEDDEYDDEEESEDDEIVEPFYKRNTLRVATVAQEAAFKRFQALPKIVKEAEIQKNLNGLKRYVDQKDLVVTKILEEVEIENGNRKKVGDSEQNEEGGNSDKETSENEEEAEEYVDDPDGLSKEEMRDWWTAMNEIWDDLYGDKNGKSLTSSVKNEASSGLKMPKTENGCVGSSQVLEQKPCLFDSENPLNPPVRNKSNQKRSLRFLSKLRSRGRKELQKERDLNVITVNDNPRCELEERGRTRSISDSISSICSDGASDNGISIAMDNFFSSRPTSPIYPEISTDKDRNEIIVVQEFRQAKEQLNSTICLSDTEDRDMDQEEDEEVIRIPIKRVPQKMMISTGSFQFARPTTPTRQESQKETHTEQIIPENMEQEISTSPSSSETTVPILKKRQTSCRKRVLSPVLSPNTTQSVQSKKAKSSIFVESTRKLPDRVARHRAKSTKDNIEKQKVPITKTRGRPKKVTAMTPVENSSESAQSSSAKIHCYPTRSSTKQINYVETSEMEDLDE